MKKAIEKIEKLMKNLQEKDARFAKDVREGGRQSQEGFERVIHASHTMHSFFFETRSVLMGVLRDL